MSFVDPASDWYSATVPEIIYVKFCNIGLCYNSTQLYAQILGICGLCLQINFLAYIVEGHISVLLQFIKHSTPGILNSCDSCIDISVWFF